MNLEDEIDLSETTIWIEMSEALQWIFCLCWEIATSLTPTGERRRDNQALWLTREGRLDVVENKFNWRQSLPAPRAGSRKCSEKMYP